MIGRSTLLTREITRTEEITDITVSSPQSRRKRGPSGIPTMQKSGARFIAPQDMIWRSARLFWITRRCRYQQCRHLRIPVGANTIERILTVTSIW
jgi:hypothetical protein